MIMARSCTKCGKSSMGGYNPQSSGMNRVRAKRRYNVNLQQLKVYTGSSVTRKQVCTRCRRTLIKHVS
jgi:ribosomal protein L28